MPIPAAIGAAAIGAGADILGHIFRGQQKPDRTAQMMSQRNFDASRADTNFWNQWSYKLAQRQFAESKRQYRRSFDETRTRHLRLFRDRVRDAKLAGLHPLFALGATSGTAPTFSVGGTGGSFAGGSAPHGSIAEAAIRSAGGGLGGTISNVGQRFAAAIDTIGGAGETASRIRLNNAQADYWNSRAKTAADKANHTRSAGDGINKSATTTPRAALERESGSQGASAGKWVGGRIPKNTRYTKVKDMGDDWGDEVKDSLDVANFIDTWIQREVDKFTSQARKWPEQVRRKWSTKRRSTASTGIIPITRR